MDARNSSEVRGVWQRKIGDDEERWADHATHSMEGPWDTRGDDIYKELVNKIQPNKELPKKQMSDGGEVQHEGIWGQERFFHKILKLLRNSRVMSGIRPEAEEMGPVWVRSPRRVDERQVQRRDDWRAHTSVRRGSRGSGYAGHECEDPETEPDGVLLQDCHTGASAGSGRQGTVVLE